MPRCPVILLMAGLLLAGPTSLAQAEQTAGPTQAPAPAEGAPESSPPPPAPPAPKPVAETPPAETPSPAGPPVPKRASSDAAAPQAEPAGPSAATPAAETKPFGFVEVQAQARKLADTPFVAPENTLPEFLDRLDYDAYRQIRYRPERAIWRDERLFEVQLFHLGFLYKWPVEINLVENGVAAPLRYARDMFEYRKLELPEGFEPPPGFAGLRLHFPLHTQRHKDEVAVFLGASYFRLLGRQQRFGASARGLAIDTAGPEGEEFPFFRAFWIETPAPDATEITVYALLDSPSMTGAYRFVIRPDTETETEVTARLFVREGVGKIGLAPLTSMFLHGENEPQRFDDYRPEVHDSDGLLVHSSAGEWVWRPLVNPRDLRISAFGDESPRGFGLMQRDRAYTNYLDTGADYHRRPSYWVRPLDAWGRGAVELVEIPSEEEIHDNIVAYWRPERPINSGDVLDLRYRLTAQLDDPRRGSLGAVVRTRSGIAMVPDSTKPAADLRLFVVDFDGGDLPMIGADLPVAAEISTLAGEIIDPVVEKHPETGGWRVFFRVRPAPREGGRVPADMRLYLTLYGKRLTETWSYLWTP